MTATATVIQITTTPRQLPIATGGSTLINASDTNILLSILDTFGPTKTFTLPANSSLPYPTGPIWAKVAAGSGAILDLQGLYNISNPNVNISGQTITIAQIQGTVKVTVQNASITVDGTLKVNQVTKIIEQVGVVNPTTTAYLLTGDRLKVLFTGNKRSNNGKLIQYSQPNGKIPFGAIEVFTNKPIYAVRVVIGGASYSAPAILSSTTTGYSCIVPCSTRPTQGITITIFAQSATTTYGMLIFGLSTNPGISVRADGRAYPISSFSFQDSGSSHTATLIAAPTSPLRIMLTHLQLCTYTGAGTHSPRITGIINGVTTRLALSSHKAGDVVTVNLPVGGVLLGRAEPLKFIATATVPYSAYGLYDIVP